MCVRLFAIWVCGFDHFWGMDFCFACCMLYGRAVGDRPVTGCSVTFVCFVVFCCVGFNRVCNSLCNILQTDTDTFSSKCDTTQEQRLLKISSKNKDRCHVKRSAAHLRWPVPLWRIVYCATTQLSCVDFLVDVRYGRHVLHIITIPVQFGTFISNVASRKFHNKNLISLELRNSYTGTKISATCSAECHYCFWLDRFETTLCYSVSEYMMEC